MSTTPISPKVTAGVSTGAIAGLFLSYAGTVQPDMFAFLGRWQGFAFLLFSLALSGVAAWWKKDPLRARDGAAASVPDLTAFVAELKAALAEATAAPSSFAETQAKMDAVTPVYEPPAATDPATPAV